MTPARTRRTAKKGFTLIELLVVVAIIAILAAILFPVFAQAREKARQTACLSNLKQIGTAFNMYAQDYDETLPPWSAAINPAPPSPLAFEVQFMYQGLVNPYIKNGADTRLTAAGGGALSDVWACPSAKTQPGAGAITNTYAYNQWGCGGIAPANPTTARPTGTWGPFNEEYNTPAPLASIKRPAEMYMLMDGAQLCRPPQYTTINGVGADPNNIAVWGSHQPGAGKVIPGYAGFAANQTEFARSGRPRLITGFLTNIVYVDGHTKSMNTQNLYSNRYSGANAFDNGAFVGKAANNNGWTRDWQ